MNKRLEEMILDKYREECVDLYEGEKTDEEIDLIVAELRDFLRLDFMNTYIRLCRLAIIRNGVDDRDEQARLWDLYFSYWVACNRVVDLALKGMLKEEAK